MKFEPVVSSCAFRLKAKVLCDILISHEIQGSHNHIHFIEHFIKWLQLHRISHYFATAVAVRATAEAAPKGRDSPVPTRSKLPAATAEQPMAHAAARRRLWRGMGTAAAAAASGTEGTLLARLVSEPESRVKATVEEVASSAQHRDGGFWEPLAAALLRASSPTKAHLVSRFSSPHSSAPSAKLVFGVI